MQPFIAKFTPLVIFLFLSGCAPRVPTVEFILPDGFRGGFAVELDSKDGQVIPDQNGKYVVKVGNNGLASIRDDRVFRSYLSSARFESGSGLWIEKRLGDVPPVGAVCLFGGYTEIGSSYENGVEKKEKARMWWFAGDSVEYEKWKDTGTLGTGQRQKKDG